MRARSVRQFFNGLVCSPAGMCSEVPTLAERNGLGLEDRLAAVVSVVTPPEPEQSPAPEQLAKSDELASQAAALPSVPGR